LDAVVSNDARAGTTADVPHPNGDGVAGTGSVTTDGHDGDDDGGRSGSRLLRFALLGALVVLVGLWAYALIYSVTNRDPERLTSTERRAVGQACEDAADRIRALPPVSNPPTNATVSARATGETDQFARMLTDIRRVQPERAAARVALHAWLADWATLLDVRRVYADEVRTDKSAKIVVPVDAGAPIFVRMNKYAESKGLAVCKTDELGAERVYELRQG
jgi:hypothetical protein